MRWAPFLIFFSVVIGIDASAHYYLYLRLFADPAWPDFVQVLGAVLLALLAIALPAGMIASRLLPRKWVRPVAYLVYVWMGVAFYFLVIVFSIDVARFLLTLFFVSWDQVSLARSHAVIAAAGTVALTAHALRSASADVEVVELEIALERLPKELEGLTLVQLSDLHVGPTLGDRFVRTIVERTNALSPDAVVITGDLVDGSVRELSDHVSAISRLSSRFGTFFVTGNHDFYSGARAWIAELQRLGLRVLMNERVELGDQRTIDLAGVHDFASGASDVDRACRDRDPERELVLLAHQPKSILQAELHRPGLVLSGHTHGGQMWPFDKVVRLAQPYVSGLHRHGEHSQIYVSRGTGYWGPPMRLFAPAEITKLVLTKK